MANAIVTFKLMPENLDVDLDSISKKAESMIKEAGAKGETRVEINPIAFGLKEVLVLGMFEVGDESFDTIAEKLGEIEGVISSEVAKMDLAMG